MQSDCFSDNIRKAYSGKIRGRKKIEDQEYYDEADKRIHEWKHELKTNKKLDVKQR